MPFTYKRNGSLRFVRIGRLAISYSFTRKPIRTDSLATLSERAVAAVSHSLRALARSAVELNATRIRKVRLNGRTYRVTQRAWMEARKAY